MKCLKIFQKPLASSAKWPLMITYLLILETFCKKSCSGLMNKASLKVRHCRNCTLNLFTGDGSLLNWGMVQPGQETIESRAG